VPGVGFGMGLERLLLAVHDEGLTCPRSLARALSSGLGGQASGGALPAKAPAGAPDAARGAPLKAQLRMADWTGAATSRSSGSARPRWAS
jgi:histidyl-tRNA synthetase